MIKTLRVRTRSGWVTKPAADTDANRLDALEVDSNFLGVEAYTAQCLLPLYAVVPELTSQAARDGWHATIGGFSQDSQYTGDEATGSYAPGAPVIDADIHPSGAEMVVAKSFNGSTGSTIDMVKMPDFTLNAGPVLSGTTTDLVKFSPDGQLMAQVWRYNFTPNARIYNYPDLTTNTDILVPQVATGIAWTPDSRFLAVVGTALSYFKVFDRDAGFAEVTGLPSFVDQNVDCQFSPDGSELCIATYDTSINGQALVFLDTSDWSVIPGTLANLDALCVAYDSTGSRLAVGGDGSAGAFLRVYNTSDWSEVAGVPTVHAYIQDISWSEDDKYLVMTANSAPSAVIVDTTTWSLVSGAPSLTGAGYEASSQYYGRYFVFGSGASPYIAVTVQTLGQEVPTVPDTGLPTASYEWRVHLDQQTPTKTLRALTLGEWATKPLENIAANALTTSEMDNNFLAIESNITVSQPQTGTAVLMLSAVAMPSGWQAVVGAVSPHADFEWREKV